MRMPRFTLRAKLICAVGAIASFAGFPLIWLGYNDTYDHAIQTTQAEFSRVTQIVNDAAELSHVSSQMLAIEKIRIEKDDIISTLGAVERWIQQRRIVDMFATLNFLSHTWETYAGIVNDWGEFYYISPGVRELWTKNPEDLWGIPFRDYLRSTSLNAYRDEFTFFRMAVGDGPEKPFLVAVRKVDGYIAVVMQALDYLEGPFLDADSTAEAQAVDALRSLQIRQGAEMAVLTGSGRVIGKRTADPASAPEVFDEGVFRKAEQEGLATGIAERNGRLMLYVVRHVKALDWYIEAYEPISSVAGAARISAMYLALWVLLAFATASLAALFLVSWFTKPLEQLTLAAQRLQNFDFIGDDTPKRLKALALSLPQRGSDEVGQVSQAFSNMIVAMEANIAALKASIAKQHSIEGELNAAREIQRGMLPQIDGGFRGSAGFEAAALMVSAKEVSGDFYDVFALSDGRIALILGDVSGKGASAALLMCVTLTLARAAIAEGDGPAAAIAKVNSLIAVRNPSCMFATMWVGLFDPATSRLSYCSAGHCPPLVISPNAPERLRWIRSEGGPLVGVFEEASYQESTVSLAPGECWLVYSDGISEAMNEKRELFGEAGMERAASAAEGSSPQNVIDALMAGVKAHRGAAEQSDDIAMLAFGRKLQPQEGI